MASERDLYNDKLFDVNTLDDLSDGKITLLSKSGSDYQFEYQNDFWKYENGILTQYADYVSMRDKEGGKTTFAPAFSLVEDYGASIVNSIEKMNYMKSFKDFSLEERQQYIASEESEKGLNIPFQIDKNFKHNFDNLTAKSEKILNDTTLLKPQELESVKAVTQALLDTLILAFTFLSSIKARTINANAAANDILMKLDNKELDSNSLLDRDLLEKQNPELKGVLKKYDEFMLNMNGKDLKNRETIKKVIDKALSDEELLNQAEKIAEKPEIQKELAEKVLKLKTFYSNSKGAMNENIVTALEKLSIDEQKTFLDNVKNYDLFKLFKDENLNPKSYSNQMEVFLANSLIINAVNDNELNYRSVMTKYVGVTDDLNKNVSTEKVANIASKIITDIFEKMNIDIEQTQQKTINI